VKVLLAYLCDYGDRDDYYLSLLPYGLTSMAAWLEKKGFDVTLANFSREGHRGALAYIEKEKPHVVGLSIFSFNRTESLKLIKKIKEKHRDVKIIAGGPHATFLSREITARYPQIDHLIQGEAEHAMAGLLDDLENDRSPEKIISGQRIGDLDSLPYPSAFAGKSMGINHNEQYKFIVTSRGCPSNCTFCSSPSFWSRRTAFRSHENIFNEIVHIHRKYGIIYFSIRDDNFTMKKDRVIKLARMIRENDLYIMWNCQARVDTIDEDMLREMKLAGLEHIQYGVESGSESVLEGYNKDISIDDIISAAGATRKAGIYLSIYLMTGMLGETGADVNKTIQLIKKILPGDGIVSPVAYYPGTAMYEEMKAKGLVSDDIWFRSHESGIFVRNDPAVHEWMNRLLNELGKIRRHSWYRENDFREHRRYMGEDCWVTDMLEGDFYLHDEKLSEAEQCYTRVTEKYPRNVWGHLRMGKVHFFKEEFTVSEKYFRTAAEIVPAYYGAWLKQAEALLALGKRGEARSAAEKAFSLNRYDARIRNVKNLLRH